MEKDLELTINTSRTFIIKWLENYLPRSGTNIQYLGEDEDIRAYIRTPRKTEDNEEVYFKLIGYPQHTETSDGVIQFSIRVQIGSLSQIQKGVAKQEVVPFLKIIEKTPDIAVLYLGMSQLDIYAYVKALAHEISIEWPETRRDIQYNDPFDSLILDKKIFEMTIEAEEKSFLNWCHEVLSQTHPHFLCYETEDVEVVLQTSSRITGNTWYVGYMFCSTVKKYRHKSKQSKSRHRNQTSQLFQDQLV